MCLGNVQMKLWKLVVTTTALAFSISANAALIQVNTDGSTAQINAYEPMGQSFLAEDQNVLFGFNFIQMNASYPSDDPVRITLYEGEGFSGEVLNTLDIIVPEYVDSFFDVDFSAINLVIGESYTVSASVVGDSPYWGLGRTSASIYGYGDIYSGGMAYTGGVPYESFDMSFRVTPTAVPVPAAVWLFGTGLIGLVGLARRKKYNN